MNYRQNRLAIALKSGKTNNVGVIVPRVNTNFFGSVIRGIEDELNASGYQVIICQTHNDEEKEADNVESLLNSQVDAIFMSTSSRNTDTFDNLQFIPYSYESDVIYIIFSEVSFSELNTIINGNISYSFENDKVLISNTSSIFEIKRYI